MSSKKFMLALLLLLASSSVFSNKFEVEVVTSISSAPDGYLKIRSLGTRDNLGSNNSITIKIENGIFKYCLNIKEDFLKGDKCLKYGSAQEYIIEKTGNPNLLYVGMGVREYHSTNVFLFYKQQPKTNTEQVK